MSVSVAVGHCYCQVIQSPLRAVLGHDYKFGGQGCGASIDLAR